MNKTYNIFRDWLAEVEHYLIEAGMSSSEATGAIVETEAALKTQFETQISAIDACNSWLRGNKE